MPKSIPALDPLDQFADDDLLLVRNTSTGDDVKATIEQLRQHFGYLSAETISGTTHTVTGAQVNKVLYFTNAAAITVNLPEDATEAISDGYSVGVVQFGDGQITFQKEGSDTLTSLDDKVLSAGKGSFVMATKESSGQWVIVGGLS